ncbi:hypothetical protein [Caballeronia sp. LZ032]|uniref:hypothetical protein n=1 Tax=Caballeronia sp. LZ032 TaxID=3038565 RepID=UPI002863B8B6|nr:hypothetical protein [Caballeronia sp. LZ032]MDR5881140.1 hypothetical protein [Caballeronia sp. LZ032]
MSKAPAGPCEAALVAETTADGMLFFLTNRDKEFFARFVRSESDGLWTFMLMSRGGKVGTFGYRPPSLVLSVEGVVRVFNKTPHGQEFLHKASREALAASLRAAPGSLDLSRHDSAP